MDPLHARYPFLPAAREAVASADADLVEVIRSEASVVERATERVANAVESRTVGESHRSDRVEVLSYPVARVLVSLLAEPALTRRYASAEARTAIDRLRADGDGSALQSVGGERLDRESFLAALDLAGAVRATETGFDVDVATYLRLADGLDDDRWRLVHRSLHDGRVPVTENEGWELLRAAVRERVAADLPLSVPEAIAEGLEAPVAELRSLLADFSVDRSFDAVEPALFPPCVKALADRVREGESMPTHSVFSYVAFLASVGMEPGEIEARLEPLPGDESALADYRIDHLTDRDGPAYLPPSCETMVAYGDCVNQDELCGRIAHPLEYYEKRLDGADPGQTSRPESQ